MTDDADTPDAHPEPDFTVELAGREVGFRDLKQGQRIMLRRMMQLAQPKHGTEVTNTHVAHISNAFSAMFDAIEPTIITDDDRSHVMGAMLRGELDIEHAYLILARGKRADDDVRADGEPDDDSANPPAALKSKKPAATARLSTDGKANGNRSKR